MIWKENTPLLCKLTMVEKISASLIQVIVYPRPSFVFALIVTLSSVWFPCEGNQTELKEQKMFLGFFHCPLIICFVCQKTWPIVSHSCIKLACIPKGMQFRVEQKVTYETAFPLMSYLSFCNYLRQHFFFAILKFYLQPSYNVYSTFL